MYQSHKPFTSNQVIFFICSVLHYYFMCPPFRSASGAAYKNVITKN